MRPARLFLAASAFLALLILPFASQAISAEKSAPAKSEAAQKSAVKAEAPSKPSAAAKSAKAESKPSGSITSQTGKPSWYGRDFHNKKTASGVAYDMYTFTAAHRTLPLGTVVKVTDQHNGKSVMVCITDRGPYVQGRIIDLSYAAAKKLDLEDRGVGKVALEVVSDERGAPLKSGHAYYVRYDSGNGKKKVGPYKAYDDAAAMHEAIRQAHPEAEVIVDRAGK